MEKSTGIDNRPALLDFSALVEIKELKALSSFDCAQDDNSRLLSQ